MVTRPLTGGEILLAKSVFGDSIDYAAVSVSDGRYIFFQPQGTAMSPDGNLYMNGCYCDDYAQQASSGRALFIHEMTHVWQFQNKVLNPVVAALELNVKHKFNYFAAYEFHLDEECDLTHYGMEQQAAIVEEYFLNKHESTAGYAYHCKNNCGADDRLKLYEKVLENFLRDPAYARQNAFPKPFKHKPPKH